MSYDEDVNDLRQYCHHGTFIGSWWGPDYMCAHCEYDEKDPSLNDKLDAINNSIDRIGYQEAAVYDFIQRLIAQSESFNEQSKKTIADTYLNDLDVWEKRRSHLKSEIKKITEMYAHLCDPELGYDDHDILRKYHRQEIDKFLAENGLLN